MTTIPLYERRQFNQVNAFVTRDQLFLQASSLYWLHHFRNHVLDHPSREGSHHNHYDACLTCTCLFSLSFSLSLILLARLISICTSISHLMFDAASNLQPCSWHSTNDSPFNPCFENVPSVHRPANRLPLYPLQNPCPGLAGALLLFLVDDICLLRLLPDLLHELPD